MNTANTYRKILDLFLPDPCHLRPRWQQQPFTYAGRAFATDAHRMAWVDAGKVQEIEPLQGFDGETVLAAIMPPAERVPGGILTLAALEGALNRIPKKDVLASVEVPCQACKASGEVSFKFRYSGSDYYTDGECPICDGRGANLEAKGEPTGATIPDPTHYLQDPTGAVFNPRFFRDVANICRLLKETNIEALDANPERILIARHYKIGSVEVQIMPMVQAHIEPGYTLHPLTFVKPKA